MNLGMNRKIMIWLPNGAKKLHVVNIYNQHSNTVKQKIASKDLLFRYDYT